MIARALGGAGLALALLAAAPFRAPTPLPLNHFYAVLDSATYADVVASPFLAKQFAAFASRGSATWIGKHTYLEFFDPRGFDGAKVGDVGLALGVERAGGIAALAHRFGTLGAAFDTTTERRGTPGQSAPWFHRFRPAPADAPSPRVAFWVMEYALEATRDVAKRDSLSLDDRSRDRFLADRFDPALLLGDLVAATVAVPADDIAKLSRTLQRLEVDVQSEGEGAVVRVPNFTLRLVPAWERPGVRRLEFSLLREATANPVFRFGGHSRLRFGPGRVATWDFGLP